MTALYGISLLIGVALLLAWIAATAVAGTVEGWEHVDPETRYGRSGRFVVAGIVGFGMAGLSSFYAGWPLAATIPAAVAGALGLVGVSAWIGPQTDA